MSITEVLSQGEHQCRHQVPLSSLRKPLADDYYLGYVGWDSALNTFFLQVGHRDNDDVNEIDGEQDMYWVGTSWGEIPTIDELRKRLYSREVRVELTDEMAAHLNRYQSLMPARKQPRGFVGGELFL